MEAYITQVQKLLVNLIDVGETMKESEVVLIVFCGLGPEYS